MSKLQENTKFKPLFPFHVSMDCKAPVISQSAPFPSWQTSLTYLPIWFKRSTKQWYRFFIVVIYVVLLEVQSAFSLFFGFTYLAEWRFTISTYALSHLFKEVISTDTWQRNAAKSSLGTLYCASLLRTIFLSPDWFRVFLSFPHFKVFRSGKPLCFVFSSSVEL